MWRTHGGGKRALMGDGYLVFDDIRCDGGLMVGLWLRGVAV